MFNFYIFYKETDCLTNIKDLLSSQFYKILGELFFKSISIYKQIFNLIKTVIRTTHS